MTLDTRTASVRTLREASLTAESIACELHLAGLRTVAARYEDEADRLWSRSEALEGAEVQS